MQTTLPLSKSNSKSNSKSIFIPTLIVDERERREIRDLLVQSSINIQIKTLDLGDYLISKDIVIERKRGDDLAGSLCDTRFFTQLSHIATQFTPRDCIARIKIIFIPLLLRWMWSRGITLFQFSWMMCDARMIYPDFLKFSSPWRASDIINKFHFRKICQTDLSQEVKNNK